MTGSVSVKLTRIMSYIFHCMHALFSTHNNTTYRCHKPTGLVKEVTSNFLGRETYECIGNVPSLTVSLPQVYFGGYFLRSHPTSQHSISYAIKWVEAVPVFFRYNLIETKFIDLSCMIIIFIFIHLELFYLYRLCL